MKYPFMFNTANENFTYQIIIGYLIMIPIVQSTWVVKYADCPSTEGKTLYSQQLPGYDTKQSDGEASKLELCAT